MPIILYCKHQLLVKKLKFYCSLPFQDTGEACYYLDERVICQLYIKTCTYNKEINGKVIVIWKETALSAVLRDVLSVVTTNVTTK